MKKFKVLGVMAIVVLMLAASMGSVSAKETMNLNGEIFVYNNGEYGATSSYPITVQLTFNENRLLESWKVVRPGIYSFITSDPKTIPKYVAAIKIYLGGHLEPLWP